MNATILLESGKGTVNILKLSHKLKPTIISAIWGVDLELGHVSCMETVAYIVTLHRCQIVFIVHIFTTNNFKFEITPY